MVSEMVYQRTLRAMPVWLLQEYLLELGGILQEDGSVRGNGWKAHIRELDDFQVGSLRVGQVRLEVKAADDVVDDFMPVLEKKLLRAGG
ncbi:MAG TPA: DUF1952 domain-containing protein [Anaerolineales bacterium]|nr:DUF1952 domain-containing protein [Anaerolineales bacterium]